MTWDEFKNKVDAEIKNNGFTGSVEIDVIDTGGRYELTFASDHFDSPLGVHFSENGTGVEKQTYLSIF